MKCVSNSELPLGSPFLIDEETHTLINETFCISKKRYVYNETGTRLCLLNCSDDKRFHHDGYCVS